MTGPSCSNTQPLASANVPDHQAAEPIAEQHAEPSASQPAAIPTLLSIAEVQAKFGRCQRTIRRWINKGTLPACYVDRSVFIRADDVIALIEKSIVNSVLKSELAAPRRQKCRCGQATGYIVEEGNQ